MAIEMTIRNVNNSGCFTLRCINKWQYRSLRNLVQPTDCAGRLRDTTPLQEAIPCTRHRILHRRCQRVHQCWQLQLRYGDRRWAIASTNRETQKDCWFNSFLHTIDVDNFAKREAHLNKYVRLFGEHNVR